MKKYKFSPSALSILRDCPRCFWLDKNKFIKRPRGIFPSLPGGMDTVIKTYFDTYRAQGTLPPEISGTVAGKLFPDLPTLDKWRSWRLTDLVYTDKRTGATLSGALDDCLVEGDTYIPLDYKTRGYELKDDPAKYYQNQLDSYCLMLEARGFKTAGYAYLLYYWPESVGAEGMVKFVVTPFKIKTNTASARELVAQAVDVLSSPMPPASPPCEYCSFVRSRHGQPGPVEKPQETKIPVKKKVNESTEEENTFEEKDGQFYFF